MCSRYRRVVLHESGHRASRMRESWVGAGRGVVDGHLSPSQFTSRNGQNTCRLTTAHQFRYGATIELQPTQPTA